MGFNTALIICNDQLDSLARDPFAGQRIRDVILDTGNHRLRDRNGATYGAHGVGALPSQHADTTQIVMLGQNSIRTLGFAWSSDPIEAIRQLADNLGYTLRKKPERKTA